jgi:hypothetical protein
MKVGIPALATKSADEYFADLWDLSRTTQIQSPQPESLQTHIESIT